MRLSVQIEIDKALDLETVKDSVFVGRASTNDLVIQHDSVSRKHCRIEYQKNIFYITDLNSSNGTFVDGQRLTPQVRTAFISSSQITIGRLECEVGPSNSSVSQQEKIISSTISNCGDYTATMRISRLELNRPSVTLANEKKLKLKGPKNPISQPKVKEAPPKKGLGKLTMLCLMALILAAAWILGENS